jgi:hypothetical protein
VLSVRRRTEVDLSTVVGWIPDAGALYFFTGPRLVWPLTIEQLAAMDADESLTAWMVLDERAQPVGHFDLTGLVTVLRRSPISLCHLGLECEGADAAQI